VPLSATLAVTTALSLVVPVSADDPGHINAYVTPYYNSAGPAIKVGKYSVGLASKKPGEFVATILRMKKQWGALNFLELYVGAIRLYDLGYRWEATYWFYSAQYQGRLYALLANKEKLGSIGDQAFELYHAQNAFFQLVGPNINGYAFGDIDSLVKIVRKVQDANYGVPNLQTMYPGVAFEHKSQWQAQNADLNAGLGKLAASLTDQKSQIKQQRAQNGTEARFSHLTSKQFPGGF
jgi:hypothetical protein